jgi:hypothetical protein
MLPLVSEICPAPAAAVSVISAPISRPTITGRMPSTNVRIVQSPTTVTKDAGLLATCANPLPERLTSSRCITRYETCLRKENVCGVDFELCYDPKHFNKARVQCQDVLAQCPGDAIKSIFGNNITVSDDFATANRTICDGESVLTKRTFSPSLQDIEIAAESRIDILIKEGKSWAAANSVKTCSNVADVCVQTACRNSPQKCISMDEYKDADSAEMVNSVTAKTLGEAAEAGNSDSKAATNLRIDAKMVNTWMNNMSGNKNDVKNYIRSQCRETVGANEWCYMVTNSKKAKEADLIDSDSITEVFDDIMFSGVGARWNMSRSKIKEWAAESVKNSLDQCAKAMSECVINACGGGSTARCYGLAKKSNGGVDIKDRAETNIESACKDIIVNNQVCQDVFFNNSTGNKTDVWNEIWTKDTAKVIAGLNAQLMLAYTEQSVANNRRLCQDAAEQCIQSECGTDFVSCFVSTAGNWGSEVFTVSDKKVANGVVTGTSNSGGFDEDMAKGLCLISVKKNQYCKDYFDFKYAEWTDGGSGDSWGLAGARSARNAWMTSDVSEKSLDEYCRPEVTYSIAPDGSSAISNSSGSAFEKNCAQREQNIFNDLVSDIGIRAQKVLEKKANDAKNACEAKDKTRYKWASISELTDWNGLAYRTSKTATNERFGGFCEVKVTVKYDDYIANYDDKKITVKLSQIPEDKCPRSFFKPAGTSFECGESIPKECFDEIDKKIEESSKVCKTIEERKEGGCIDVLTWGQRHPGVAGLLAGLGGSAIGAVGGLVAGNAISNSMSKNKLSASEQKLLNDCDKCIKKGGEGYSETNACAVNTSACVTDNDNQKAKCKDKAIKACADKKAELEAKSGGEKNKLFSLTKTDDDGNKKANAAGIAGMSVGAVVLGTAAGVGAGVGLKNAANKKEREAWDAASEAWLDQMSKIIKCTSGGVTYGFEEQIVLQ